MEDEEAIERVLAGDINCFGLLIDKYQNKVLGMIYNMTRDHHLSEDLCQDVFMDAYRSLANFDSARSRFSTWLYRITQNKAINALRKRKPLLFAKVPERAIEASGFEKLSADELHREFDRILDRLPVRQKAAFVWSEIEELPYKDIAEIEGVGVGTIKSRISRARRFLRYALKHRKAISNE
jgi:RNA polymerase sigma-70 factor (ECF subfamily)